MELSVLILLTCQLNDCLTATHYFAGWEIRWPSPYHAPVSVFIDGVHIVGFIKMMDDELQSGYDLSGN